MSEFKGTKGKWKSLPQKGVHGHCYQAQVFVDGVSMACIEPTEHEVEASANALLISKAPEMLEMLDRTHDLLIKRQFPTEKEMSELAKEIEQLIKTATEI